MDPGCAALSDDAELARPRRGVTVDRCDLCDATPTGLKGVELAARFVQMRLNFLGRLIAPSNNSRQTLTNGSVGRGGSARSEMGHDGSGPAL